MRRAVFLFAMLFSFTAIAQPFKKVKADPVFNCADYSFVDPLYGKGKWVDSIYGIPPICDSKNQIEIRLGITYAPTGFFDFAIFTYDGKRWSARNYTFNFWEIISSDTVDNRIQKSVLITELSPDSIAYYAKVLYDNNVFTLPDQHSIKVKKLMTCGTLHVLTFKVGNDFRTYDFNNPQEYAEKYPKQKEFRCFLNIVRIMNKHGLQSY